ncbi:MAG: DNA mismatch repair protein MutS [Paludibacteraceae bacterium]|nr:DNA mismatch repair protein MutS [Paludibacteraceae bacterium]
MSNAGDTPMMRQFRDVKNKYPDAVVLFRCGDFYETYCEDAVLASRVLGITLTKRSNGAASDTEMAGFPYHALDTYLPKLVRSGHRVAICDQLEDPKLTKKLVKRGVTELVTPGVSYSDTTINTRENNFVACIAFDRLRRLGIAFLDISTGEFMAAEGDADYARKLITNLQPKEVLYERGKRDVFENIFGTAHYTFELEDWMMTQTSARERLLKHFGTQSLKGFGIDEQHLAVTAAGAILHYLDMTQHLKTSHIQTLARIEENNYVWLDPFTVRNLELLPDPTGQRHTLTEVLDHTITPMGARLIRRWITLPLKTPQDIRARHNVVDFFVRNVQLHEPVGEYLRSIGDLERLISKVSSGRITPRELYQVCVALHTLKPLTDALNSTGDEQIMQLTAGIKPCSKIADTIKRNIRPDAPSIIGKGAIVNEGVDSELDELRGLSTHGREKLLEIQQREIANTGITSLKIGFNNVFGYYIEVRNTFRNQVPPTWIRRQTLVSAERYITEELKEYEEKITSAEERIAIIENRIFNDTVIELSNYLVDIQRNAHIVAQIDCLLNFAILALDNDYSRPDINDSLAISIVAGRHPVIERFMPIGEQYVPNDVTLDNDNQQIVIITGPNMAGKSALLRQTALIVLMAQIGSFVPAKEAHIGVVDRIFTRVGASDNISSGESTFMVEMNESASILNNLTDRSLVLFDELGRGTSTYDGISIAWSIVEYIHEGRHHAKTLFATHYHELNEMEKSFARIKNYNVSVREVGGKIIFLRKLERGGSEHSFGIHVAKLAGMPQNIIKRANIILDQLEKENRNTGIQPGANRASDSSADGFQLSLFQLDDPVLSQIRDQIRDLDINSLTPLEALNKLSEIKKAALGK